MRKIDFFDGATSETTPVIGNISATSILGYPDDASYEAANSGAPFEGNLYGNTTTNEIRYYNGTSWVTIATVDTTQTFTNKTIDADSNTISNIDNNEIKALAGIDATKIADGSVSSIEFQYLANVTSDIQGQLDAQIDATQIADGSVDNAEFQYLNGVTSPIQTQIDNLSSLSLENGNQDRNLKLIEGGSIQVTTSGASSTTDIDYTIQTGTLGGGAIHNSGSNTSSAYAFTTSTTETLVQTKLEMRKFTGTTGSVFMVITNSAGNVPGSIIVTSDPVDATTIGGTNQIVTFDFANTILPSGEYFWYITSSGGSLGFSVDTYTDNENVDSALTLDGGSTWTSPVVTDSPYFQTLVLDSPTTDLILGSNAYIQVPGLTKERNTILAQTISFTLDNDVAFVSINRDTGSADNLTVSVSPADAMPLGNDTVLIARNVPNGVLVGTDDFFIPDGETLELYEVPLDPSLVTLTGTQTLSNKTLSSPIIGGGTIQGQTASSTNKWVLPKDTKANLDSLTRDEGAIYYAEDLNALYVDDGSTLNPAGGAVILDELGDVDTTTVAPVSTDILKFDGTNWVPYRGTFNSEPMPTMNYNLSAPTGLNGSYFEWRRQGNLIHLKCGAHYTSGATNDFMFINLATVAGLPLPITRTNFTAFHVGTGGVGNGGSVLAAGGTAILGGNGLYLTISGVWGEWHMDIWYRTA